MKIAVVGAGAVGGYFGARLAAAGEDVVFIARGAHLDAIRADGLEVHSHRGNVRIAPARASDDPRDIGAVDVVVFAVKLYDVERAGEACRSLLGPDTVVISFLNGVDSEERLAAILGPEHVAGGVAHISAVVQAPGMIRHNGDMAALCFGEMDGTASPRLARFAEACQRAAIDGGPSPDIAVDIWRKFAFLASFAGLTALTRLPAGPLRSTPGTRRLLERAIAEVVAVAAGKGIDLGPDAVEATMRLVDELPQSMKASMLYDLERGRRLELDWLCGGVTRIGRELGVDTPVHEFTTAALEPYANGIPWPAGDGAATG